MPTTPGDGVPSWFRRTGLRDRLRRQGKLSGDLFRRLARLSGDLFRRLDPVRRAMAALLLLVLVGVAGVVASAGFGSATAEATQRVGRPVPAGEARVIAAAGLSCPALTPARLAGQLMAASGFDAAATTATGRGVAGLSDAAWERWKPRASARRDDPAANILALAHLTCDLVGQVRHAGIGGDPWRLALGAYHSGLAAVRETRGVPAPARQYVDTVAGYAAWYAHQPGTGGGGPTSTRGPVGTVPGRGTDPKPVPDDYLAAIRAAGHRCAAVTPARVAAQLMASSGFNPNLLGPQGGQGIAQFTPELWARYAPFATATSPWDPAAAVPALGRAMCSLVGELSGVGGDPYLTAVAAFRVGPDAVRQAGGVPDNAGLRDHLDLVTSYADHYYGRDPRLGGSPSAPTGGKPSTRPTGTAPPTGVRPPPARPPVRTQSPTRPPRAPATTRPPAKPDWQTRVVNGTSVLRPGQSWSTNRLRLTLTANGNLALYDQGRLVWSAGTGGRGAAELVFQADGNFVLYTSRKATIWSTRTDGHDGAILVLQADGNVTISQHGRTLWQTGTAKAS
ncbi:hypothetical protein [Plantactinospora sp. B5E13]|uniref:hypothetical protein n=1 Tax=Plantactinospora sp. B5E13 TaxID=3153758 RepID=UPI00325C8248